MQVVLLAGDERGFRAVGDLLNDLTFASAAPVDFTSSAIRYDTLVVPCLSAFGVGGHVADRLLAVLGPTFSLALASEMDNRFAGEQTKGSAFVIPTSHERFPRVCWACVSAFMEKSPPEAISIYTATRAALLAATSWNQKSSTPIKMLAIPLLNTSEATGMDVLQEATQVVAALKSVMSHTRINRPKPSTSGEVARRQKELFEKPTRNFQTVLESGEIMHRGLASELELNALIAFVREYEKYPNAAAAAAEALAVSVKEKRNANGPDCPEVQRRMCSKDGGCWPQLLHLVRTGKANVHDEADPAELSVYEDSRGRTSSISFGSYKSQPVTVRRFLLSPQVIPDQLQLDLQFKEFRTQIAYFSLLRHPNLLPMIGAFTMSESALMFRDTSTPVDAVRVGLSVVSVISFLHSVDVVHKDLKASSFVVGDALEDVYLSDFGNTDAARSSRPGAHTPPEVVEKNERTDRSDVYGLGVILWELSVRREIGVADLLAAAKDRNALSVRDVPGELAKLVKLCWDPRSSKRPSAAVVHKELIRLVGSQPPPPSAAAIDERRAADLDTVQVMMQEHDFAQLRAIISRLDPQISANMGSTDAFDAVAALLEHFEVAVPVLTLLMEKEIEKIDSIAMCLRGDSTTIVLISRYFTYIGGAFLDRTLKSALTSLLEIQSLLDPRPLNPSEAGTTETLSPEGSRHLLKGLARSLFESLVRNAEVLPSPIHAVVKNLYAILCKRWPAPIAEEDKKLATVAVTSTLFLRFITPSLLDPPATVINKQLVAKPRPRANLLMFAKYVQTLIGAREDPEKTFGFSIKDLYHPYCEALVATTPRPWVATRLKPSQLQTAVTEMCNVVRNPTTKISAKVVTRVSSDPQLVPPPKPIEPPAKASGLSASTKTIRASPAPVEIPAMTPLQINPTASLLPPNTPPSNLNLSMPLPRAVLGQPLSPSSASLPTSAGRDRRGTTNVMEASLTRVLSVIEPAFSGLNVVGKAMRVWDERWLIVRAKSITSDLHKEVMGSDKDRDGAFRFSFDLGHALGRTDARSLRTRIAPSTLAERFCLGLALPSFGGLLALSLSAESTISDDATLAISCSSITSIEAHMWHEKFRSVQISQGCCHLVCGFLLGWCEECAPGMPLAVTEYMCRARGDDICRYLIAPASTIEAHLRAFSKGYAPNVPILKTTGHTIRCLDQTYEIKSLRRAADTPRTHKRNPSAASPAGSPSGSSSELASPKAEKPEKDNKSWLLSKVASVSVPFPLRSINRSEESETASRIAALTKRLKGGMPARTDEQIKSHTRAIMMTINRDPTHASIAIDGDRYVAVRAQSLAYDFVLLMQQLAGREGESAKHRSHNYAAHFVFMLGRALGRSHQKAVAKTLKLSDHPLEQLSGMSAFLSNAGFASVNAAHLLNAQAPHPDGVVIVVECAGSAEAEAWRLSGANTLVLSSGVCALCCGFIAGWVHRAFGLTMSVCEITCTALGDDHCTILLADSDSIDRVAKQHLQELGLSNRSSRLRVFPFLQAEIAM